MDLAQLMIDIDERRGSTRVAAYKQLMLWLQEGFRRAELQPHNETLMARIAKTLWEVPTMEERDLALLVLARLLLTNWLEGYDVVREPVAALSARGVIGAIECQTIWLWISFLQSPRTTRDAIMAALAALASRVDSPPSATCWAHLTATAYPDEDIRDIVAPESAWLCERFVATSKIESKIGIGWALATLLCATRATHESDESFDGGSELASYLPLDEVLDSCHESKQLKPIAIMLETGKMPQEKLVFLKQEFVFSDFRRILAVRFLREVLGEGFYNQLSFNVDLQSALRIEVEQKAAKTKLSGIEKRMTRSPNSPDAKIHAKELKRDRERKHDTIQYDTNFE